MTKAPIESVELTELFEQINRQWELFVENHNDLAKGNKKGAQRARAALGEIKKLVTKYRQASTAAVKQVSTKNSDE
jgi:hypothetical protein